MRRPAVAWLALVPLLAACSSTGPFRSRGGDGEEVAALQARVLELQRQVTVHEVELARLRERVNELEAGRSGGGTAAPRVRPAPAAGAGGGAAPEGSARLRQPAPPASSEPLEAYDLEEIEPPAPPRTPPPQAPPAPAPAPAAPPSSTPPPAAPRTAAPAEPAGDQPSKPVTAAAQALYDQGYTLYHQGRYADAEGAFQRFLQAYGNTDLADNAGYWIGESRYSRKDYRGALAAFREAIDRHPDGNKVPDSLLKVGRCLEQLGDVDGAREVYRELVRRFPGSGAAASGEERLGALP
jgi:tol-pal system protein YbgF